jgi:hypothetical protein
VHGKQKLEGCFLSRVDFTVENVKLNEQELFVP